MKKLNILDLHRNMNEKKLKRTACFEKVLETCHKKIVTCSQNNKLNCFYEVPDYVIGYPLFDLNECIRFLIDCLTKNGFLAIYYFPRYIYISWDFEEIEKAKKNKEANKAGKQVLDPNMQLSYKPSGKLSMNM